MSVSSHNGEKKGGADLTSTDGGELMWNQIQVTFPISMFNARHKAMGAHCATQFSHFGFTAC